MSTEHEEQWHRLATETWKNHTSKSRRVRQKTIEDDLWTPLEKERFQLSTLSLLESLGLLEEYLWPGYTEDATNHHVLLIAMLVTAKRRQGLSIWDAFFDSDSASHFPSLFRRLLSLSVDSALDATVQTFVLDFLIIAFQSLDNASIRKECAPLVSIAIWTHLHSDGARETKFEEHVPLRKAWRASNRRFDAADEQTKARVEFDRDWLFSLMLGFLRHLYQPDLSDATLKYCERFLELLIDLESQLPTRRYVNALVQDLDLLVAIKLSPAFRQADNGLLHDLHQLLSHYVWFAINDHTGTPLSVAEAYEVYANRLARLQRVALKHFKDKLTLLALSNYSAIENRADLLGHFADLTDEELEDLATKLQLRQELPAVAGIPMTRNFRLESIATTFERHPTYQQVLQELSVVPTEDDLYKPAVLRNEAYDGSRSLALPKLNLQYLSIGDFLWRSFVLYRAESFFEIRNEMEEVVRRLQPRLSVKQEVQFGGSSKMALPITKPGILEVAPAKVGMDTPSFVRAEITLNIERLAENVRHEWESLRPGDVLYLLTVRPDNSKMLTNGDSNTKGDEKQPFKHLRTADLIQVLDESGKQLREGGPPSRSRIRRLIVHLDPAAYHADMRAQNSRKSDVYDSINILVRRKGRENNAKRVLESIKILALSGTSFPSWLRDVFLGFGDPASASYANLSNKLQSIDYRDTFLDWAHLKEALPETVLETDEPETDPPTPPYILRSLGVEEAVEPPTKKRKQNANPAPRPEQQKVKVSTYRPPNKGPYPGDQPLTNQIRFTPAQVAAITSGTQPGLTVIVGPPGTGKTDVATQIINNIYHDFPEQRTLLIAHSNQALNQLFQKITKLDIDQRHLLRLGHGEDELETDVSYGKSGRVESFLDNRGRYLAEVDRLAVSIGAPGAHGQSCETADYFKSVYITPAWIKFWDAVNLAKKNKPSVIRKLFPFYAFFANAPKQPLFPDEMPLEEQLETARGCQTHIDNIFAELEDIRPFEIVRSARDRANYLLIKEARIIAMTSTHAAMRRQEIADTGFHYDNIVMEEAAQITEIENFIPLTLQHSGEDLKRVVLCGDHLQNSPIIQNLAFRQFSNLEQSMFQRLVRLGVPAIHLDRQGRSRHDIAELYRWRYNNLGDLPAVLENDEYKLANAGFRYNYQFIDVGDYKGAGEKQPTPHFIQNLGEAEYAVAIYQYMRLLDYPASTISILTTYAGQRALIMDVLNHRCKKNRLFGLPRTVTTVDRYQGEQNDYVILSLVRTNRVGYLRDVRRLTVALSRARLGLYVLGRRELFESCPELAPAFKILLQWPTSLMVVPGETVPTTRAADAEIDATPMTGVEHLGQYVYEMTQAKIEQLKSGSALEGSTKDVEAGATKDLDEAQDDAVIEQPEELDQ